MDISRGATDMADGALDAGPPEGPKLRAMDRVLMLMALGLDPRFTYTDPEIQGAWRRRMAQVHPDKGGNTVMAAAVNASYISLVRRVEMPRPVDLRL
jgi:hypothetical protein